MILNQLALDPCSCCTALLTLNDLLYLLQLLAFLDGELIVVWRRVKVAEGTIIAVKVLSHSLLVGHLIALLIYAALHLLKTCKTHGSS